MIKDATINIRTNAKLKEKAQNTAAEIGLPLSLVINQLLKGFIKTKRTVVDFGAEEPSKWLSRDQNEQLRQDAQALAQIKFDDLPSEDEWLALQPPIA